jgi:hypothetical protein
LKFLSIYTPDEKTAARGPAPEHMADMGKLIEEGMTAGWLLETGAMLPLAKGGARVRKAGGDVAVLDGPFAEAKEVIAGYAIISAGSRDEAIGLVRKFLKVAGDGECDLLQIMDQGAN